MTLAEIGALLRREREARGLSLNALGGRCGLTGSQVHNVEHGRTASDAAFAKVAQGLGYRFHVSRTVTPADSDVVPVLLSPSSADQYTLLTMRDTTTQENIRQALAGLLELDDYHVALVAGQVGSMLELLNKRREDDQRRLK